MWTEVQEKLRKKANINDGHIKKLYESIPDRVAVILKGKGS